MIKSFRVLLVYPNIPMMLVTPLSIALFTWILKREGCEVHLFDTTQYGDGDLSSPQKRVKYLQARERFSEDNLRLLKSTQMTADFLTKLTSFQPELLLYSFTEDAFGRALQLLAVSNPFKIPTVVIERVVRRCKRATLLNDLIVATTIQAADHPIIS